ncbi:MAG TPA: IclR family transcriptional regulator [Gammaproteobacteria bacterium]|nr:IclR family transcriptional regulator [Gammaproteobacteria bacterium]
MQKITTSIQVLDRATTLLDSLAQYDAAVSLKILAADAGLHPSTAFRILASLTAHGLVGRDPAGQYHLGIRLLSWGGRVRSRIDLRGEARPVMEWLRDQIGETVNLTIREGDNVVYVERVIAKRAMRVEQVIGSRAPLHVTAVGKLMLGDLGEEAIHAYAGRTGLPEYTQNTLTDEVSLLREIKCALLDGYAFDNEEAELGVGCIGVVIRDSMEAVVAGLSISAPIERWQQQWVDLVKEAGERISQRLGYAC